MQKIIIFLVAITSILAWSNRRIISEITDASLASTPHDESFSPAVPKWVPLDKPWASEIPPAHAEILSGSGKIIPLSRTTNTHTYTILATTDLQVRENTLYFPGWQLFSNNQPVSISPNHLGIITFSLPPGEHNIKLNFTDTPIRAFSKQISLISLLVLLLLYARSSALRPA